MGVAHEVEVATEDGLMVVDLAVLLPNQRRLAVVDVKRHETSMTEPYQIGGYLEGTRRMLLARGWEVVVVPWYEWEGCGDKA